MKVTGSSVADVMIDALVRAGARRCYGIVGDTLNHFTDAIRSSDLDWVHVRHEEVGAFAAGAEAYMTGELAVCAGSTGPGSLHFINGIFESHRNGAPVVLVASNIESAETGFAFPQEVDQARLYEQCSVFCEAISDPAQARRITVAAAQAALTKGGVSVIVVNGDMFTRDAVDEHPWAVNRPAPRLMPSQEELDTLAREIRRAERICLYAGIGARDAMDQVRELAARLAAPIAHTTRAKEFAERDNPFNVGMTGVLGSPAGVHATQHCDLMIALGTDFAYTQYWPEKARIVQIDRDPTHLGRRAPVDLGLAGHVSDTITELLPLLEQVDDRGFLEDCLRRREEDMEAFGNRAEEKDPGLIHPQYVATLLDELAPANAAFTADGGSPMVWMLRHLTARDDRRFLGSLLHGTMANAYPQAIGIQKAYPDRPVIALCGDGGFTMLMGDVLTLVQEQLPIKLLIFNNGSLGFVEMEQRVEGLLDAYTELRNPDFSALAVSCGLFGARVESSESLESEMRRWLDHDGPALLDVKVNRLELVMPPNLEAKQVGGSMLFGAKAVLDGRFQELLDLARNNLWR
jgi:pyruvate dehydrogenase (quinone)